MALATRCPHCNTTFRVAQDQLKLRAGLVRCGACKQIFNGADHLLQAERQPSPSTLPPVSDKVVYAPIAPPAAETQPAVQAPAIQAAETPPAVEPSHAHVPPHAEETAQPEKFADFSEFLTPPDSSPETEPAESLPGETPSDPLQGITLIDFSEDVTDEETQDEPAEQKTDDASSLPVAAKPAASNSAEAEKALESAVEAAALPPPNPVRAKTLDELRPGFRPAPSEIAEEEDDEPDFVRKGRRKQRMARTSRIAMSIGSWLLLIGLAIQGAYAFRDMLAASSPKMKTLLTQACESLGCAIRLPAQIDSIVLESSDFQSLPDHANTLVLTMLLRNQSRTVQAWPQIELTLNDTNDKPVARRILAPQDYLPAGLDPKQGFPSRSEQSVKTYLQVSQLKPEGYRLYLFYP